MANRFFNQFPKTLEKEVVTLYAKVSFGVSGAPTLDTSLSKGIVSVSRTSAGIFVFTFGTSSSMLDVYNKLLHFSPSFDATGTSAVIPAAPIMTVSANSVATSGVCTLTVKMFGTLAFTGSALSAHNHDLKIIGSQAAAGTDAISAKTLTLGKESATDITIAGANSATLGGVVAGSSGTPAGTLAYAATDPASGEIIRFKFQFKNSTAQ